MRAESDEAGVEVSLVVQDDGCWLLVSRRPFIATLSSFVRSVDPWVPPS